MPQRNFDPEKIKELQALPEYGYYDQGQPQGWFESFLGYIKEKIAAFFEGLFEAIGWSYDPLYLVFFEYFFYALMIGGVIFFILKMIGVDLRSTLLFRKTNLAKTDFDLSDEDIQTMDFDELIANAEAQSNFVLLIRYHYLQILKLLSDKELIQYEIRKTNEEYRRELKNHPTLNDYKDLVLCFEKVWYGRIKASSALSSTAVSSSANIKKKLS